MSLAAASGSPAAEPPPLPEVREARRERGLAVALAVAGLVVFAVARSLDPYGPDGHPRGHGTHRQLGLPACTMQTLTGVGCPSCGMTTTFSLLTRGDWTAAWQTNWAACIVAPLAAVATLWFIAVAFGVPVGRMTADEVVKFIVMTTMALAMVRWAAIVASKVIGS